MTHPAQRQSFGRTLIHWAGMMALVLTIMDTTPWPLWHDRPWSRLIFIALWAATMAWWQPRRLRASEGTESESG